MDDIKRKFQGDLLDKLKKEQLTYESLSDLILFYQKAYKDEIPNRIISSDDKSKDTMYKIRTTWHFEVGGLMQNALMDLEFPEEIREQIQKYIDDLYSQKDFSKRLKTQEDIDKGNKILDLVMHFIEEQREVEAA